MALIEARAQDLGPWRAAEKLINHLDRAFDARIAEMDRYGGCGFADPFPSL